MIEIPISHGELVDKVTILKIKSERIKDEKKLRSVRNELSKLKPLMIQSIKVDENHALFKKIYSINSKLWDVEDKLRVKEKNRIFDSEFTELARQVYYTNDERAAVKKEIDLATGSEITEEKSYEKYA